MDFMPAGVTELLDQMGFTEKTEKADLPNLIARMNQAASKDQIVMKTKRDLPAAHKFAMVPEVEQIVLGGVKHQDFIHNGGLYALSAWMEPYADGSLPFRRTRTCVMKIIEAMAPSLNASDSNINSLLGTKASKLAYHVARVANSSLELPENRRIAKSLMERWARQTYATNTEHEQEIAEKMKELKLDAMRQERKAAETRGKTLSDAAQEAGLKGNSTRVSIPVVSKLDYVINPRVAPGLEEVETTKTKKNKGDGLQALEKARRKSQRPQRGAKVEIHLSSMVMHE